MYVRPSERRRRSLGLGWGGLAFVLFIMLSCRGCVTYLFLLILHHHHLSIYHGLVGFPPASLSSDFPYFFPLPFDMDRHVLGINDGRLRAGLVI